MPKFENPADALFEAVWGGGPGVTDPDKLRVFLEQRGLDGSKLIADAQTPEAKTTLRSHTQDAVERGVFGVPTVFVGDEMFWGFDSFDNLDRYLSTGRTWDPAKASAWDQLKPESTRRRAKPSS